MSEKSSIHGENGDDRPIIVTAEMASDAKAFYTGLRQKHFPPARNFLDAHITLFHALPASLSANVTSIARNLCAGKAPMEAKAAALRFLGNGVAITIDCPELSSLRTAISQEFLSVLTPQDKQKFSPHITIQNKVTAEMARTLYEDMGKTFAPSSFTLTGVGIWRYDNGPWELKDILPFEARS